MVNKSDFEDIINENDILIRHFKGIKILYKEYMISIDDAISRIENDISSNPVETVQPYILDYLNELKNIKFEKEMNLEYQKQVYRLKSIQKEAVLSNYAYQ